MVLLLAMPAAASDYPLPAPPPGPRIDYSAEYIEFDADRSSLHLSTDVVLNDSTWTIRGQDIWVDTAKRSARSDGPLMMGDGISAVYGTSGEFDFVKHSGRLYHSSSGHAGWRIHAREARLYEDRRLVYRGADFTSCDAVPPHYHFRASSLSVIPKKRILAWNPIYYLGPVPIFYLPFFYKSINPDRLVRWRTQPGIDSRNGPYAKNTLTTSHGETVYSKLFADYYSKQGIGYGGELHRRKGEDSRAVLYGYRIQEHSNWERSRSDPSMRVLTATDTLRWQVLGDAYQAVGSLSSLQARLQVQSDADFNNHYARSSSLRATTELLNSAAFVHRFRLASARVSYSRTDNVDRRRTTYLKTYESVPRLDISGNEFRIGRLPWLNYLTGFADNQYTRGNPFLHKTAGVGWEGTRNFLLPYGVSFTPRMAFTETYSDRRLTAPLYDAIIGRWTSAGTFRFDTPLGGLDVTHTYAERFKHATMQVNASAVDKGIETNATTISNVYILNPRAWARVSTGYDFRTYRDRMIGFRPRVMPLTFTANWLMSRKLHLTLYDEYKLDEGNRAFIGNIQWGDDTGFATGVSVSHNLADPAFYYGSFNIAVAPSTPTWRVAFRMDALALGTGGPHGLRRGRMFDKELSWSQHWHDFHTKLTGRVRYGGVKEFAIRINMKFGYTNPKQPPRRDWEAEWFPERARNDEDRP